MESNRLTNSFEKASQEYFKEVWEFSWTLIGILTLFVLVLFGIYFSQVAIANVIGAVGIMLYFTWSAAIAISALEVAGIKLLGDKIRSMAIETSNKAEYRISKLFTIGLFIFDVFTNWTGIYLVAVSFLKEGEKLGYGSWAIIIFFGSLMAISEILVGWMIRAVATSYVSFLQAKQKYEAYKTSMEKSISDSTRNESSYVNNSNANNQGKKNDNSRDNKNNNQNIQNRFTNQNQQINRVPQEPRTPRPVSRNERFVEPNYHPVTLANMTEQEIQKILDEEKKKGSRYDA